MYFGADKDNAVTLPHSAQRKHAFTEKSRICQRKINFQQERNCFRIATSEIRAQINQVIVSWR